jgi:anti-anti-sigma regulatory factor
MSEGATARSFRAIPELGTDQARLVICGEIDLAAAPRFERSLATFECLAGSRRITVDLSRVAFIDVAGWRALRKRVERCDVVVPAGPAKRVFDILD